jgi:hypothetical protein
MSMRRTRNGGLLGRLGRRNGGRRIEPLEPVPVVAATKEQHPVAADESMPEPATASDTQPLEEESASLDPDAAVVELEAAIDELKSAARDVEMRIESEPSPAPDQPVDRDDQAERDARTPRLAGPLEAFLRHPFLTLLPVLLLVGGAVYFGTTRDAKYTAHARITVGRTDVPAAILQNAAFGNQVVAGTYARGIAAPPVIRATARRIGLTPGVTRKRLTASTVPESTLIDVQGVGSSADGATALANAGANALIRYVGRIASSDDAKRLLRQYRVAQAEVRRLEVRVQQLRRSKKADSTTIARAQLHVDTADLEATQLANLYRAETTADETAGAHLTLLAPAGEAKSDFRSVLEQLIAIAVAAGLVLGFGFALLRTNWGVLRARRE